MTDYAPALERLSMGGAALDAILGGGIPSRSVTIVAGEPGTGRNMIESQRFRMARITGSCGMWGWAGR